MVHTAWKGETSLLTGLSSLDPCLGRNIPFPHTNPPSPGDPKNSTYLIPFSTTFVTTRAFVQNPLGEEPQSLIQERHKPVCTWRKSNHLSHRAHFCQLEKEGLPEAQAPPAPLKEKVGRQQCKIIFNNIKTNMALSEPSGPNRKT